MAVMLSDLLRNLTFNRSAHCTQVSDQCPLGLLFVVSSLLYSDFIWFCHRIESHLYVFPSLYTWLNICNTIDWQSVDIGYDCRKRLTSGYRIYHRTVEGTRESHPSVHDCNPRRGLPSRGCCKSWTRGWDSLVPSTMW